MTDLKGRFEGIDRVPAPEEWTSIRERSPRAQVDPDGAMEDLQSEPGAWVRIGTIAAALAIGLSGVVFAIVVIGPDSTDAPVGSTHNGPPGVFFPTTQSGPADMLALFKGTLVEHDGCVFMRDGSQESLPIWPEGYTIDRDGAGVLEIRATDRSTVATVGLSVSMGGGYIAEFFPPDKVESQDAQLRSVEELIGQAVPPRCLGRDLYGVWLVGSISAAA